jgi:hypothetical protein
MFSRRAGECCWAAALVTTEGIMLKTLKAAAALAAVLTLAACAGTEIPFDRSTAGVRTIGVLTPDVPAKPSAVLASDIGQSFGLIGALADAAMQARRDDKLFAIMIAHQFVAGTSLGNDLVAALRSHGYEAKLVPVARDKSGFLKTYPTEPGVDAFLDVSAFAAGYGYVAAGIGSTQPYRPFVWLNVKLVHAGDNAVLMQDTIMYNAINANSKWITISPDPAYQFADFDTLVANPDQTVAGENASLQQTANQIGMLVR